jgi:hypothetical protein
MTKIDVQIQAWLFNSIFLPTCFETLTFIFKYFKRTQRCPRAQNIRTFVPECPRAQSVRTCVPGCPRAQSVNTFRTFVPNASKGNTTKVKGC